MISRDFFKSSFKRKSAHKEMENLSWPWENGVMSAPVWGIGQAQGISLPPPSTLFDKLFSSFGHKLSLHPSSIKAPALGASGMQPRCSFAWQLPERWLPWGCFQSPVARRWSSLECERVEWLRAAVCLGGGGGWGRMDVDVGNSILMSRKEDLPPIACAKGRFLFLCVCWE